MPPKKKSGSKAAPKRVAANGYKLPDPISPGVILTDIRKNRWKLGKSIGVGGFGEIYLACEATDSRGPTADSAEYCIKIEPHANGPLFAEIHCYMRIAESKDIDQWIAKKKLKQFGMPRFMGSGSHEYKGQKYRFMVMERYSCDLQKVLLQHNRRLSLKTVYMLGYQIVDILEYIHSKEYVHSDVKASNLMLGFKEGTENQIYLVDYGLACHYAIKGKHKVYQYDQRKAHEGTIEYTSRDAHVGAHSRRGDLEILAYNLVQWLAGSLPWENNLSDCEYVAKQKRYFMDNIPSSMDRIFGSNEPPGIREFVQYVATLTFDETPDYDMCRFILKDGMKRRGYRDDGKLVFNAATPKALQKTRAVYRGGDKVRGSKRESSEISNDEENTDPNEESSALCVDTPKRKRKLRSRGRSSGIVNVSADGGDATAANGDDSFSSEEMVMLKTPKSKPRAPRKKVTKKDTPLMQRVARLEKEFASDPTYANPTPAMLALMEKRKADVAAGRRKK